MSEADPPVRSAASGSRRAGFQVTIFDERLAWEKPCGGGLTHKAIEAYPFLLDSPHPKKIVRTAELISSRGHRARFEMSHPIVIYARKVLNGLLLDRAIAAGCTVVCSRVTSVQHEPAARSPHRLPAKSARRISWCSPPERGISFCPETTALGPRDLEMTLGYFVPTEEDIIKVKFLKQFEGYLWSFPRADHLSVGICAKMGQTSSQELRRHLDEFVREEKIPMEGAQLYSHVLPSPEAQTIRGRRIVGKNWAMAGDAAACVDPITGEGLFYALRSGDLLAQALARRTAAGVSGAAARGVFSRPRIRRQHRAKGFSRHFSRRRHHHAHGPAAELFAGVPRFDPRRVQRLAGLSQPEAPPVEISSESRWRNSRAAFSTRAACAPPHPRPAAASLRGNPFGDPLNETTCAQKKARQSGEAIAPPGENFSRARKAGSARERIEAPPRPSGQH